MTLYSQPFSRVVKARFSFTLFPVGVTIVFGTEVVVDMKEHADNPTVSSALIYWVALIENFSKITSSIMEKKRG